MLNHELSAEFRDCLPTAKIFIQTGDPESERLAISKVTFLTGSDPEDTILETSREGSTISVQDLVNALASFDSDGKVQIFVRDEDAEDGEGFAYYDILSVRRGTYHHTIFTGAYLCGG